MWHLRKIPRVAHFYWGHDYMPWVRWLTLATFRKKNPDWDMVLWQPTTPVHVDGLRRQRGQSSLLVEGELTPDYLDRVNDLRCAVKRIDIEEIAHISLVQDVPSVHVREQVKGDYLRLWLLSTLGGVSLDMDLLFYKPMEAARFNVAGNADAQAVVCRYPTIGGIYYWGFMYGAPYGDHFTEMWNAAIRIPTSEFQQGHNFYRVAGHLAAELWPAIPPGMINMPFQTFMTHTDRFDLEHPFPDVPERIGIHWHGSSSYGTFVKTTPETWREVLPPCLMRESLARALEGHDA